jgi:hypothetical protein
MSNFKETNEVLALVETTSRAIGKKIATGDFSLADALNLFKEEAFQTALLEAIEKIKQVPVELQNLSIFDSLMLGKRVIEVIGVLADAFKVTAES